MTERAAIALALVVAGCGPPSTATPPRMVIGSTSVDIDTRMTATRTGEAAVGDFVADTLRDALAARPDPPAVALVNAGAIRGGDTARESIPVDIDAKLGRVYPAGPLTYFDVEGWYPFRDDHVIITVTGDELRSALERGAAQLPPDLMQDGGGPLMQIAGGAYTIDCAGVVQVIDPAHGAILREGTRVVHIEVGGRVIYDVAGGIDELATTDVRLVVNGFAASGFDGHLALTNGRDPDDLPFDDFNVADALVARVTATSPIAPKKEGRITVIGDCGQPLTFP